MTILRKNLLSHYIALETYQISSKCSKGLVNVLKTVYFFLFQSHLSCAILAQNHFQSADRLLKLQMRAIRIIRGTLYRQDCKEQFSELQSLTFPYLYILYLIIYLIIICKNDHLFQHCKKVINALIFL